MGTAGRSFVRTKNFTFTQGIEEFSWRLRRGVYESPKYYCESTRCNWTLLIEEKRESFFWIPTDYIEMSLKREDHENENQSVKVRLTVVDSFNAYPFYASKEIDLSPSCNEAIVLRMEKTDLFDSYFGLNKRRFVPNDILTVKCEITSYENVEENYESEVELQNTLKHLENEGKFHHFAIFLFRNWLLWLWHNLVKVFLVILVFIVASATISFYVYTLITVRDFLKSSSRFASQDAVAEFIRFAVIIMLTLIVVFVVFITKKIWYFVKPCGDRTYKKNLRISL